MSLTSGNPSAVLTTRSSREHELQQRITDLCAQASRCRVIDDSTAEAATTLAVAIKSNERAIEDDRKSLTDPLNGVVKNINARYKLIAAPIEPALSALTGPRGQLTMWNQAKRRAAEEAARLAREEAERIRLEQAAAAEEAAKAFRDEGDAEAAAIAEESATAALEAAVAVPEAIRPAPTTTRGLFGGSSSVSRIGKFRIEDLASLLEWELANVRRGIGMSALAIDDATLGKIARSPSEKPTIPGVVFYYDETTKITGSR